mmetsp:Transcript_123540/g.308709  ORF Transcript_123540/g.308709 Transcript_123540/m.308709 type:complete len:85 (-) Transcript_123540:791-1045(-)
MLVRSLLLSDADFGIAICLPAPHACRAPIGPTKFKTPYFFLMAQTTLRPAVVEEHCFQRPVSLSMQMYGLSGLEEELAPWPDIQ